MKSFIAVLALVAVAAADVSHIVGPDATASVVKQLSEVEPNGFRTAYETSNGIFAQEEGVLTNEGREDASIAVQGKTSYTGNDGKIYTITYVADANGFQPQGEHLPTPPAPEPIPDYILRSLQYIRDHPPKEEAIVKRF